MGFTPEVFHAKIDNTIVESLTSKIRRANRPKGVSENKVQSSIYDLRLSFEDLRSSNEDL